MLEENSKIINKVEDRKYLNSIKFLLCSIIFIMPSIEDTFGGKFGNV